jgi:hypothetical protein
MPPCSHVVATVSVRPSCAWCAHSRPNVPSGCRGGGGEYVAATALRDGRRLRPTATAVVGVREHDVGARGRAAVPNARTRGHGANSHVLHQRPCVARRESRRVARHPRREGSRTYHPRRSSARQRYASPSRAAPGPFVQSAGGHRRSIWSGGVGRTMIASICQGRVSNMASSGRNFQIHPSGASL